MNAARARTIGLLSALAAQFGWAQASLPAVYTGPWELGTPPAGWTFAGLGLDYLPDFDGLNDGAAKLDGTGDHIAIHFDGSARDVSYWVKGLTFSGGTFSVEQSSDGSAWTALATYTALGTNATRQTNQPSAQARHLRFIYTLKGTGNVGLDGIAIAELAFVPPEISAVAVAGGTAVVAVAETVIGRTYALEYALDLAASPPVVWTASDAQGGTGSGLALQDAGATNAARFYRVRDATPLRAWRRGGAA